MRTQRHFVRLVILFCKSLYSFRCYPNSLSIAIQSLKKPYQVYLLRIRFLATLAVSYSFQESLCLSLWGGWLVGKDDSWVQARVVADCANLSTPLWTQFHRLLPSSTSPGDKDLALISDLPSLDTELYRKWMLPECWFINDGAVLYCFWTIPSFLPCRKIKNFRNSDFNVLK